LWRVGAAFCASTASADVGLTLELDVGFEGAVIVGLVR
jgi:hypothetical protein